MSTILDIADAVTAGLNAGPFDPALGAERRYQPAFELPELADLKVSVVPKSVTITNATRESGYFDCAIDIGIQKKIADDTEVDALVNLVEQIADHLRQTRLDSFPGAAFVSIANEPVFAPEHLDTQRVFTSVLTVTYRVRR